MEISKQTVDLLKSFATINSNILIKQGSTISTMSASKDIFGEVTVSESFTKEAGIFNLNEFLGVVSLFEKPDYDFSDKFMTIKEGRNKIKYVYADASLLTVPTKSIKMPSSDIEFTLTSDHLNRIQKAAAALSVGDLAIVGDGKTIVAKVMDIKNPTSNDFELDLDATTTGTFSVVFKIEKLKLYAGGYDVVISSKKISQFKHKDLKLQYFVAVEASSTFS